MVDSERAVKNSGSRFAYLMGPAVRLEIPIRGLKLAQILGQPCECYLRPRRAAQRLNNSPIWRSRPRARQPRERPTAWRSPLRLPVHRRRRPPKLPWLTGPGQRPNLPHGGRRSEVAARAQPKTP